ncbi:MAG: hypothetical protein L3K16_10005 [Thermoplasmata archaeon]|nr:hypothetical protein [Thermoplasmata archaeon]
MTAAVSQVRSAGAAAHPDRPNTISVPFVVLASVLMGVGLMLTFTWLITFDWDFFPGILVVVAGALMMLDPRMGSDHA